MKKITKCDYCDKDSIGYVSRVFQGPFYCEEHKEKAERVVIAQLEYMAQEKKDFDEKNDKT